MQSVICWIAGGLLLALSLFGGRVAKEYEDKGLAAEETLAMCLGWGLAVLGALLWRIA